MKIRVDEQADALYLRLDDSAIVESREVAPGVVLDYNAHNQVIGIELLHLSKRTPKLDLRELLIQTAWCSRPPRSTWKGSLRWPPPRGSRPWR
jgi:uncharacterized protein YuzE